MAKLMLEISHKTGTYNAGLFMPLARDFVVFKLCMHQVHEFASILYSSVCQPASALVRLEAPDAPALKATR